MKKIILFILLLTLSQKITYAFDLIPVPKDISKLNILGITFDSKIDDFKKLLSTNPNLTGRIIPIHYISLPFDRVSVAYYIEPKTNVESAKDNFILVNFFNNKVARIYVKINHFLNGAYAKPSEVYNSIFSDPSTTDGLGDLLLEELIEVYGNYRIQEKDSLLLNMDVVRNLEWSKGKYRVNYVANYEGILFVNNDIEKKALAKLDKLNKLEKAKTVKINANRVAFRDEPRISSKVLARLNKGELLTELEKIYSSFKDGGGADGFPVAIGPWRAYWYIVRRSSGQVGYVYGWFLDPVEE